MTNVLQSEWFWAVLGVIFAIALGVSAPIFGALISENVDFKKRQYEMYYENKLEAYSRLLTLIEDASDYRNRREVYLSPEFALASHKAQLLSSSETSSLITALTSALGEIASGKVDKQYDENFQAYVECLYKLIASMKLALLDAKRLKLYIRKAKP